MRGVNRRLLISAFVGAIEGIELVAIDRGLSGDLAGVTQWLLYAKDLYDVERAPLPSSANEEERRGWFAAVGADLGEGELRVAIFGRGERFDVATVRQRAPFGEWAPSLLDRAIPTGAFVFSEARDVAVFLQRKSPDVVARVAHGATARLVAAVERDRANKAAHAATEIARIRTVLVTAGVEVLGAPEDLPSPEVVVAATPWHESSPVRRFREHGERVPGTWLAERLASLGSDGDCYVWVSGMRRTWLSLRAPPGAAWLLALWSAATKVVLLSSDRARTLVLCAEEHDDVACLVATSALLDRAASLADLDARLDDNDGLRVAASTGPRGVDPAPLVLPSRRYARGRLTDPSEAAAYLAALVGDLDMAERIPEVAKRDGVIGCYSVSMGREAPLAFRTIFTFDAGKWLVDLWQPDVDRLFVARPDDKAILALVRVDDEAEAFLASR